MPCSLILRRARTGTALASGSRRLALRWGYVGDSVDCRCAEVRSTRSVSGATFAVTREQERLLSAVAVAGQKREVFEGKCEPGSAMRISRYFSTAAAYSRRGHMILSRSQAAHEGVGEGTVVLPDELARNSLQSRR